MTAKFWNKRAQKYDDNIEKHDGVYLQTIESTKSLLSTSDVVLDLGCASGEFSLDIASRVQRVHGIDTSTNMIAIATEKASDRSMDNVTFNPTDLFDRSLDAHGYTVVLAFNILHLVEDVSTVLGRINRLLPTGGLLISQTPCLGERGLLFRLFVDFAQKVKLAPPILSLTVQELERETVGADFEIAESKEWDPKNAIHWIVARKRECASWRICITADARLHYKALQLTANPLRGWSHTECLERVAALSELGVDGLVYLGRFETEDEFASQLGKLVTHIVPAMTG